MVDALQSQRWGAPIEIFAKKLSLEDNDIPRGWLKNSVVIEPGTRACAIVDGRFIGEIPAGEFTFHDIRSKLQFWRHGTATIVLTRSEVVHVPVECDGFISRDDIPIELRLDIGVQIEDPAIFVQNMMGPRKEYPVNELAERLIPSIKQEAWTVTARLTANELRGPATAAKAALQIVDAIAPAFRRYGLSVFSIEGFAAQAAGMEKHWERVKQNNVEVAGERLANQRMGEDVGILADRIALREKLRDVFISDEFDQARSNEERRDIKNSDQFDQARSDEELKTLIAQVDKARLLRREEMDQLFEGFEQRKDVRRHIVEVLDVNRQQEIEQLRAQVGHSLKMAAKKNELELAEATNSVENLQWRNEIAREIEMAEKQRDERRKDLAAKWDRIRESQRHKHDGSWERLVHEQREEAIRTELAIKEAERNRRVRLLEAEAAAQVDAQRIIAERQRREFKLEIGGRESDAQFDRLKRVQDMNFDNYSRQLQLDAELMAQADVRSHSHEIEKLKTMGTLSAEALIAGGNTDNAKVLAELKMQEAKSQAEVAAAAATASVTNAMAAQAGRHAEDEDKRRLTERLLDSEKSKSEAIQSVFQQALKGQQDAVAQMISGLAAAHTPPRPEATPAAPLPFAAVPLEWHVAAGGGQTGPHSVLQIEAMIQRGQVAADSLIWKAGMAGWVAIAECPEFSGVLAAVPPPPPPHR